MSKDKLDRLGVIDVANEDLQDNRVVNVDRKTLTSEVKLCVSRSSSTIGISTSQKERIKQT
jgi:hypothetical protein